MKNSNNIFMIGWEYPPHNSGGLGVACQGLTQALAKQDNQIYFTLPYNLNQSVGHMNIIQATHPDWQHDLSKPPFLAYSKDRSRPAVSKHTAHDLAKLPSSELEHKVEQYAQVVSQEAKRQDDNFDLIHAHDWMSMPAAIETKKATAKPMVAHIHSTEFDRIPAGNGSQFIHQTEYEGLQAADRIVAVSYYTKRLLINKYNIDKNKIDIVHNGINPITNSNPNQTDFAKNRPVITFMGRLTGQKGPEYFLELAKKVVRNIPEALFIIAGNGDLYHELLFKTAQNKLSTHVLFSGFVRDKQKEKLLDRSDVFIMPSLSEPFGLVAIEAAQRQTPVIISKNAGVAEVLPSAIQVDFWDLDLMLENIKKILSSQDLVQDITQNQLHNLKNLTWEKSALDLAKVYRRAFLG